MEETENNGINESDIEAAAAQVARSKANVAKWGVNSVIFLFALLIIIIVLVSQDISMVVVAPLAVIGLGYIWFTGWRRGKQLYTSYVTEEMINIRQKPEKGIQSALPRLTTRELQVLTCIAQGYANKQIALELGISENTVKHFSSRVMSKLNASGRTDAVVIALKNGIISLDE